MKMYFDFSYISKLNGKINRINLSTITISQNELAYGMLCECIFGKDINSYFLHLYIKWLRLLLVPQSVQKLTNP